MSDPGRQLVGGDAGSVGVPAPCPVREVLTFKLPTPPPSMNCLYKVNFVRRQTYMDPEARTYKTMMKMYVPRFEVGKDERVGFEFEVARDWWCKNGAIKRIDVQNMVKVLVDLIAEKQGWDDSQVWEFRVSKVQELVATGVMVRQWKLG